MHKKGYLLSNASVINEGAIRNLDILIEDDFIKSVGSVGSLTTDTDIEMIDCSGMWVMPGMIDDQVHFREPGLTHKADMQSESRAAVAGGITSFMEMPNTVPQTLTQELLEDKYRRAAEVSVANYSFYMGASNDNLEEILKTDPSTVCGIKVFMGASTGNMLVDDPHTLEGIFSRSRMLVAVHCEDESTIRNNIKLAQEKYGDDIPVGVHPDIRSREACYKSSSLAVELAKKHGTRLHILHISTADELSLFSNDSPSEEKKITAEACVHHLWFNRSDYAERGNLIKWNPAVKEESDRKAILNAVKSGVIDVIATDHAPHTLEEKSKGYLSAPSGAPMVQHALVTLLELYHRGEISLEQIVLRTSHTPAKIYSVAKRGFIREGYYADLVIINPNDPWVVSKENILYKCGWSPLMGQQFTSRVITTFVNGKPVWNNQHISDSTKGKRLLFER